MKQWGAMLLTATLGMSAYFLTIVAIQLIDPTVVSALKSLEIIFSFAIQVIMIP